MKNNIKEKISVFPKSPGVYQFIDKTGDILYVGKAKNLRNRIKSYFAKEIGRGPGIENMVLLSEDIRFIETDSEIEAFILESDLINKLSPKYNVRLKDGKSFLMVKITKEDYPCVSLVRYRNVDPKDKTAWYFGPYPSGMLLKKSLYFLRKVFPYRDCSAIKFRTCQKKNHSCIYGDIRICTIPCTGMVNSKQYKQNITFLKNFLKGRKEEIIKKLNQEMKKLSQDKRYEEASLVRNQLVALEHIKDVAVGIRDDFFENSQNIFKRIECYDISNIGGQYAVGSMVVFVDGKADKDEYRKFKIKCQNEPNDLLMMEEILTRRFKNDWPFPDLIVIDGGETHLNVARKVAKKFNLLIPIVSIAKGPDRNKNDFYFSNSSLTQFFKNNKEIKNIIISARDESHRFAISYYRKLHIKDMLNK